MVGARAPGTDNVCRIFVVSNTYKKEKWLFLKDALWGGGGTHRSWPGGRGGRPRALIPGEGVREGLAWRAGLVGSGGVQGLRFRGQGTEQISQRVSYFCCF